jgi:hypothetical protein
MKKEDFDNFSDLQIVEYFRNAVIRRAQCGFNVNKANKIFDLELSPAYEALAARGSTSLQTLLSLTDDPNPNVRENAAMFAFDSDPSLCREVLKRLIGEPGWVGTAAVAGLAHKDPEFAAEFARLARLGHERFVEEMARRYPRPKERK